KGNLGQPHGGWPEGILKKVLKGEAPLTDRPGKTLLPVDLDEVRAKLAQELHLGQDEADGEMLDEEDLNGYLMYPKVFMDYRARHRLYGPVRILPTRTFFYGMTSGEEITAEIDPGKTLEVRLQAVGDVSEDGEVKVFFELNGQPRVIRVPNRAIKAKTAARPKAADGNTGHIGAPMPGSVASVAVTVGQKVRAGDLLLTIEAMKMETGLHADREAVVKALHVHAGSQIDAKDLLIELE
ncbi:MAG: biotin/lipoyl-containing protein, partial [Paracoccaceae bacterium]